MPPPIPALGYSSRTAAILGLRQKGLRDEDIASKMGIPLKNLRALVYDADRPRQVPGVSLELPDMDILEAEAKARGFNRGHLASQLLKAIIRDDMFAAVLDI